MSEPSTKPRWETRDLGRIDTNYWGFRFPDRRSPFDLTAITQRWLRDITWDCLADLLDGPTRPRTAGPVEQIRRSLVCLSATCVIATRSGAPGRKMLTGSTGKDFVADFTRRVTGQQPVRGVTNRDGSTSAATRADHERRAPGAALGAGGPLPYQSLCTLTTQTNRIKSGAGRSRTSAPSTTDPYPYVRIPRDG